MTSEQLAKLPKWAQEEFNTLLQQRDTAVAALRKYTDNQTPSAVKIDEMLCLEKGAPEFRTRYIQTERVQFEWSGVELSVHLSDRNDRKSIDIQWESTSRMFNEVIMQPRSYQNISIFLPTAQKK